LGKAPVKRKDYNACEKHTFTLKMENFKDFQRTFDGTSTWKEISETVKSISLSEIPQGTAKFEPPAPAAYALEVFLGDKKLAYKDGVVNLPEGASNLTLKSSEVLFKANQKVEIAGGKSQTVKVNWKELGTLIVQAEPSNCKVYVDGIDFGAPPVERKVVEGEHEIKVIPEGHPEQAQVKKVTIEVGATRVEPFSFNF
jgi:hypothetical protein